MPHSSTICRRLSSARRLSRDEEIDILKFNVPFADEQLLLYVADFLQKAHRFQLPFSSRDGVHIARYASKLAAPDGESPAGRLSEVIEAVLEAAKEYAQEATVDVTTAAWPAFPDEEVKPSLAVAELLEQVVALKTGRRVTQTDAMEKLGFTVQDLTEDLARQFGYEKHRGVLISQVVPGSENSPGSSGGYFLAPQVVVRLLWGDAHGRQFAHCLVTIFLKVQSELLPFGRNNTVT